MQLPEGYEKVLEQMSSNPPSCFKLGLLMSLVVPDHGVAEDMVQQSYTMFRHGVSPKAAYSTIVEISLMSPAKVLATLHNMLGGYFKDDDVDIDIIVGRLEMVRELTQTMIKDIEPFIKHINGADA